MSYQQPIRLDIESLCKDLKSHLGDMEPPPTTEEIRDFLSLAYFASLEREEGLPIMVTLALVAENMINGTNPTWRLWHPVVFKDKERATVQSIAKLAPAIDLHRSLLAITPHEEGLKIAGVIRSDTEPHRLALGQVDSGSNLPIMPLIVRAFSPGILSIDIGYQHFGLIDRDKFTQRTNFGSAPIFNRLHRAAKAANLNSPVFKQLLRQAVYDLSIRGHGGTIVLAPENFQITEKVRVPYQPISESPVIHDVVRYCSGEEIDPVTVQTEIGWERARRRAVAEYEFMRTGAGFLADLASVDGALLLSNTLKLIGFGCRFLESAPNVVEVYPVTKAGIGGVETLDGLGTRHNSAARFCHHNPDALVFVVSQDGHVTALFHDETQQKLLMWRPFNLASRWLIEPDK